jgi:hypothetical protein
MSYLVANEDAETLADAAGRLLVESNPIIWLQQYGHIRKKNGAIEKLKPNPLQDRVGEVVGYMLGAGLPVRILIYKPRQKGSSTVSMGVLDWWLKKFPGKGYLCGNELSNCRNLWDILNLYNFKDDYDWGFGSEILTDSAKYGNGSSAFWATAKNAESGRSATLRALVMTEIARWAEDEGGVRDAGKVFSSLMGAVPKEANTLVIGETTVRGGSGVFHDQWGQAKTLEQVRAGDYVWGDFVKVFMPWYVFDDSVLPVTDDEAAGILNGAAALNDDERNREQELVRRYRLTAGHLKYWRIRLKECDYDPEERDREEPTTEESGFYAAQPSYFSKGNLRKMRREAEELQSSISRGILDWSEDKGSVAWTSAGEEDRPLWMLHERPMNGRRYILGVDNSRGVEVDKGKSDCHAPVIVRCGYVDKDTGSWVRPAVVMAMRPEVRIEIDLLADEVAKAAKWYGDILTVPERNNDGGLIKFLRDMGVNVFEQLRPATDKEDQKGTGKFGIWTSDDGQGRGIRSEMLAELRRAIRQLEMDGEGLLVPFLHMIDELECFVVDPVTGKAAAMPKKHDDFVMALAFAFYLKERGTIRTAPALATKIPRELAEMMSRRVRGALGVGGGAHHV